MIEFNGKVGNMVGYKGRDGRNVLRFAPWKIKKSMSKAVQLQRLKLGNIVNLFQMFVTAGRVLTGLFTDKKRGQSDYNAFMQANMFQPVANIFLTKQMVMRNACVAAECQVSSGELPQINISMIAGGKLQSLISLGEMVIGDSTTVAELSGAIINNNPELLFQYGDNIVFLYAKQSTSGSDNIPVVSVSAQVIKLDGEDFRTLSEAVSDNMGFTTVDGHLGTRASIMGGACWIHTRDIAGKKYASTQTLVGTNDAISTYQTDSARDLALASYGGYVETFAYPEAVEGPAMP